MCEVLLLEEPSFTNCVTLNHYLISLLSVSSPGKWEYDLIREEEIRKKMYTNYLALCLAHGMHLINASY